MNQTSQEFADAIKRECGIDLDAVDTVIRAAHGVITDEGIQRVTTLRHRAMIHFARGFYSEAMAEARVMFAECNALNNALTLRREVKAGSKSVNAADKANAIKTADAKKRHAQWQRMATELWSQKQHADKSTRDIARLIAMQTGDNRDTIRKAIKKLA